MTECDALTLDIHHVLEQQARANVLSCFSFNGSGGIWRKDAIQAAGGFSCETVTEDLDLSYKAFLAGFRFVYVPDLPQLLELPSNILAYKLQKNRWNKGFLQVFRKSMGDVFACSHMPISVCIEAFFHVTYPITCLLGLCILFMSPLMVVMYKRSLPRLLVMSTFLPLVTFLLSGLIACYAKV